MKFMLSKQYLTGIELFDGQHRNFVEIANEILALMEREPRQVTVLRAKTALDKLGDYALYHFSTEEEYLRGCQPAGLARHLAAHESYRKTIREYLGKIHSTAAAPEASIDDDIRGLLKAAANFSGEWLLNHIMVIDKIDLGEIRDCAARLQSV